MVEHWPILTNQLVPFACESHQVSGVYRFSSLIPLTPTKAKKDPPQKDDKKKKKK